MTDIARYFMSPGGPYSDEVLATAIPSRQATLRYGWFVDRDSCFMVYVRRASNGKTQHFRRLDGYHPGHPGGGGDAPSPESPEHRLVKEVLVTAIQAAIAKRSQMRWAFKDQRFHFPFTGDLLEGVTDARAEYPIAFPDGRSIRPDVALIGPDASGASMVRWAIEVMRGHELDVAKMMKIYAMGLPTMVVDISGTLIDQITPDWATAQLLGTCADDPHGRRPNFIHLPDALRTVLNGWSRSKGGQLHKFVIFGDKDRILALRDRLKQEATRLRLPFTRAEATPLGTQQTDIAAPNNTNDQTQTEFQNVRRLIPDGWVNLTGDRYLRITTPRPTGPGPNLDFHMRLAHLVATDGQVIMGYDSKSASHHDDQRTAHALAQMEDGFWKPVPLAPKVVCYPIGLYQKDLTRLPSTKGGAAGT